MTPPMYDSDEESIDDGDRFQGNCTAFQLIRLIKTRQAPKKVDLLWIGEKHEAALYQALATDTSITSLRVRRNRIKIKLAQMPWEFNSLLQLTQYAQHVVGSPSFGMVLRHNNFLRRLDISNNAICDEGAAAIAEGLTWNLFLRELVLCNCGITGRGVRMIAWGLATANSRYSRTAQMLRDPQFGLRHLDITENMTNDVAATAIAHALAGNVSLERLYFGYVTSGSCLEGIQMIGTALATNTTLNTLCIDTGIFPDLWSPYLDKAMATIIGKAIEDKPLRQEVPFELLVPDLSPHWKELGLPITFKGSSNKRIIKWWVNQSETKRVGREKLVAFGMGLLPRLGHRQGEDQVQCYCKELGEDLFRLLGKQYLRMIGITEAR